MSTTEYLDALKLYMRAYSRTTAPRATRVKIKEAEAYANGSRPIVMVIETG
jgi:hypothetical protein